MPRLFLRVYVYRTAKPSPRHVAEITGIERRLGRGGIGCVPAERAKPASVTVAVARSRPGRLIAGLGMIVPNQRFPVFRALINSVAKRRVHQQQQRSTKQKVSSGHVRSVEEYSRSRSCATNPLFRISP